MTQRDVQDHWNSLANQLGAEPAPPHATPLRSASAPKREETPRRVAAVPAVTRVPPVTTDWASVAVHLGVVPAEPLMEARKWRLRDTPTAEQQRDLAAERGSGAAVGGESRAEEARSEIPAVAAEPEIESPPAWMEDVAAEESGDEPRRRRRRRRSRGRDRDREDAVPSTQREPNDGGTREDSVREEENSPSGPSARPRDERRPRDGREDRSREDRARDEQPTRPASGFGAGLFDSPPERDRLPERDAEESRHDETLRDEPVRDAGRRDDSRRERSPRDGGRGRSHRDQQRHDRPRREDARRDGHRRDDTGRGEADRRDADLDLPLDEGEGVEREALESTRPAEGEEGRRRRRGRRGGRGRDREEGRQRSQRDRPAEPPVAAANSVEPEEPEDIEDQEARAEDHRNIPAWQEAIGVIIEKNMEARAKNPYPQRHRGRGRGRG